MSSCNICFALYNLLADGYGGTKMGKIVFLSCISFWLEFLLSCCILSLIKKNPTDCVWTHYEATRMTRRPQETLFQSFKPSVKFSSNVSFVSFCFVNCF